MLNPAKIVKNTFSNFVLFFPFSQSNRLNKVPEAPICVYVLAWDANENFLDKFQFPFIDEFSWHQIIIFQKTLTSI